MATNILGLADYIQNQYQNGLAQGRQSKLAQLAGQAYGAPAAQRRGLVQQAIGVDPDAGFALGNALEGDQEARMRRVGQMAGMIVSAPEGARAGLYAQQIVPELQQLGMGEGLPPVWSDDLLPYAQQLAQLGGGVQGVPAELQTFGALTAGLSQEDAEKARRIKLGLDPRAGLPSVFDTGMGVVGIDRGGYSFRPITEAGSQRAPGEVPFSIDPRLPPEVQEAIRNNPDAGSAQGIQSLDMGQQLRSVPEPKEPPDTFVTMSPDEVAAAGLPAGTVAQRSLKTGKIEFAPQSVQPDAAKPPKPMPVSALRLVQDAREKLSIADGNIQSLSRIAQQIQNGELDLGLLANAAARVRNFTGNSTPESRNFALMMSSLEKLRNDSLRLNNGVQTEGDAQRAWNELMANLNDERVVADQINRIIEINKRAAMLHQANMDEVNANYGPGSPGSAQAPSVNNMSDAEILEALNR